MSEVLALRQEGLGARRIARRTGLPTATVRDWLAGRLPAHSRWVDPYRTSETCARCGHAGHAFDQLPDRYVYLLGLYLGDGCISEHARKVFRLRVFLDACYPLIVEECQTAMRTVMPRNKIQLLRRGGNFLQSAHGSNLEVSSFSKSWPCLIPQHGPGKKHARLIELTGWQRRLVDRHPGDLLRGLIHSDGSRFTNTGRGGWSCPRYAFTNLSTDIRTIFCDACDALDLHWTRSGEHTIYVSRKADVALLDAFIGPKR